VANRIEELSHKFPDVDASLPQRSSFEVSSVGSPIAPEKTRLMSDRQWIGAMRRYSAERGAARADFLKGGAIELARVLELDTQRERPRFAALALRMEDEINPVYFSAILDGLCASGASSLPEDERNKELANLQSFPTDVLADVIRRLHRLPKRPCGMSISRATRALAGRAWPDDVLEIVVWYAQNDPNREEELWQVQAGSGRPYYGGDPESHGIDSVRGAAAEAIAGLLFADIGRLPKLWHAIESLVADESFAVRSCAIDTLLPLLNSDRELAVSLFLRLVENAAPIYGTNNFEEFVHYAAETHYSTLRGLLLEALASPSEDAAVKAGRQISVAGFRDAAAAEDATLVRRGSDPLRKVAAEVYASNLKHQLLASLCSEYLKELFHDENEEVLEVASRCFVDLESDALADNEDLLSEFIESPAFNARSYDFLDALVDSVTRLPDIVCRAAERAFQKIGTEGSDLASDIAMSASTLCTLVVRLYSQTDDEQTKVRCLDLIDRMEEKSYYGIDRELKSLSR
jgi:hypothetical protein